MCPPGSLRPPVGSFEELCQPRATFARIHYWTSSDGVGDKENGRYYRRFLDRGKPVLITEFANVGDTDSDEVKGQQYQQYYNTLDSGVLAAFAFVSSASDPTFNQKRETWVRDGVVTAIPGVIGS